MQVQQTHALIHSLHFLADIHTYRLDYLAGAADCASCVAVLLEIARVLVSDPSIHLPGPVLFLFNGGEETLMQAAHGFVSSGHRWVSDIGAFINLEATGSGGPDTLFQHTGGWTAETYAAAAKYPRGSVFLQVFPIVPHGMQEPLLGMTSMVVIPCTIYCKINIMSF